LLLTPDDAIAQNRPPKVKVTIDGHEDTAKFTRGEGSSTWYTTPLASGDHKIEVRIVSRDTAVAWKGHAGLWLGREMKEPGAGVVITAHDGVAEPPMPPRPFAIGVRAETTRLGELSIPPDNK
jgi:hypothetical protein